MNVIPAPRIVATNSGARFVVTSGSRVSASTSDLDEIVTWFLARVSRLTGIDLALGADPGAMTFELDEALPVESSPAGIRADDESPDCERYSLEINAEGIRVTGATLEGAFRGATSLLHLITDAADRGEASLAATSISDAPRFAWRGLSLDVVRTFHPPETVKTVIDLLALYKMNVLHLHLTDSEGWRFEVPEFAELTAISSQTARDDRAGGFYTREEYVDLIQYAAERYITIVPEFDSPGHTASVLRAYPELATEEMHASDAAMQYLDPENPATWDLVRAVYEEMAQIHPGGRLHVGGDEAIAMTERDFARYMAKALPIARATGKGIVAWQETARAGFSEYDLMQWWISPHLIANVRQAAEDPESSPFTNAFPDPAVGRAFIELFLKAPLDLPDALDQGAFIIISRADLLYLDTQYAEPSSDLSQDMSYENVGIPRTVYGNGTVEDAYAWDPSTLDDALPDNRIAGIEAAIWCERIRDERELTMQLLPRLPGVAEKGWSDTRSWADYHPRLAVQRRIWNALGVHYYVSAVVWPED